MTTTKKVEGPEQAWCGTKGRKMTEWIWDANYRNGAHHLKVAEDIEGTFKVASSDGSGDITREQY